MWAQVGYEKVNIQSNGKKMKGNKNKKKNIVVVTIEVALSALLVEELAELAV